MKRHLLLAACALIHGSVARAHGGQPPIAYLSGPDGVGEMADQSYTVHWIDTNMPIITGTASIDFYYTANNPPTFSLGRLPPGLEGEPIVLGVPELDRTDAYEWDTSAVPTGTYWLWSYMREPPTELGYAQVATFSPGVLSIVHPGDPVPPAIFISAPDTPFRYADAHYLVRFVCLDPDGTGRVKLEATPTRDGTGLMVIADDLPAAAEGSFDWDTSALGEGDWTLKATITDGRGMSFSGYSRYFLLISHPSSHVDAGPAPDAPPDSGAPAADAAVAADLGATKMPPEEVGACGCTAAGDPGGGGPWPALLGLLCLRRRRR